MSQRPSKLQNTIKRKVRKLSKEHNWQVKILSSIQDVTDAITQYHEVYNNSWKVNEPFPHFITGLTITGAKYDWTRLGILSIDNTPAAAQIWLVKDGVASIYKLAYKDEFHSYSPGTILTVSLVEHVIHFDKVQTIDYLTGDDNYKKDWMQSSRPLYGIQLCNSHSMVGMANSLRNYVSGIKKSWSKP